MIGLAMDDEHLPEHPHDEAIQQRLEGEKAIGRNPAQYLHFPWAALDEVIGGIAPGEIWFVGAYSGMGKTSFLMSALDAWYNQGRRIYYMGLESKASILRTQWACQRLGLIAGEVLSGAMAGQQGWEFTRERLLAEMKLHATEEASQRVYFSPAKFVNPAKLRAAFEQAADLQSDVLIIDHVDHLEGSGKGLFESSVSTMKALLALAHEHGVKVLAATQFNNEMIRGNRLGQHLPPTPTAVYMGNHKRMIASGMIGLYKPLKFDITADEMKKYAAGQLEQQDVIEKGVMAVSLMKHRLFGNREGKRVCLGFERGCVVEPDASLTAASKHGISSGRAA